MLQEIGCIQRDISEQGIERRGPSPARSNGPDGTSCRDEFVSGKGALCAGCAILEEKSMNRADFDSGNLMEAMPIALSEICSILLHACGTIA